MPIPREPNPLPAPSLRREEAERRLVEAIVRGELAPGERLIEEDLAAWLGISRTPVREALGHLDALGLVVLDANRGAHVAPLVPERMLDLIQVARELSLLAQRLAAERATDEEIEAMQRFHETRVRASRADDTTEEERAATGFHLTLLAAARNEELLRVYPTVSHRVERIFRLAFPAWMRETGLEVDGALLEAIAAHDPVRAAAASGAGWDVLERSIRARLADESRDARRGEPRGEHDEAPPASA